MAPGVVAISSSTPSARGRPPDLIERIADERIPREGQVDPDLVRATCGDGHFEDAGVPFRKPAHDADMARRRPAAGTGAVGVDGRRQRVRDRPDRRVDRERVRHPRPRSQGQVDLEDAALEHGRRQEAGGRAVAREEDGSGRAAAEPVERRADGAVALADQVEQSVLQEEAAGKDGQARGLRQDEDVLVLVERHEFPRRVGLVPRQAVIEEGVAPDEEVVGRGLESVPEDLAGLDPPPPLRLGRVRIAGGIEGREREPFVGRLDAVGVGVASVHRSRQRDGPFRGQAP